MNSVFLRFPEGKPKTVTFSYDDGVPQDRRLAALFDRYGLKATFNFNSEKMRKFNYTEDEIREIFLSKGHEIALHGAFHRANGNIRPIEGIQDVLECRLELEKRCGRIIRGMAYPNSGITQMGAMISYEKIRNYLMELDIAYARTLGGDNDHFRIPQDFYRWMPSAHHNNPKVMEYIDKFLAIDISEKVYHDRRVSRLLYIWGHSYEFDTHNNWEHMEQICRKLAGHDEIWYATNMQICEYVESYKRLHYSADGRWVYNPTLLTIWLDVDAKLFAIEPGQTVCIGE